MRIRLQTKNVALQIVLQCTYFACLFRLFRLCAVDKYDSKILKINQKAEATALKANHKAETADMKAALQ